MTTTTEKFIADIRNATPEQIAVASRNLTLVQMLAIVANLILANIEAVTANPSGGGSNQTKPVKFTVSNVGDGYDGGYFRHSDDNDEGGEIYTNGTRFASNDTGTEKARLLYPTLADAKADTNAFARAVDQAGGNDTDMTLEDTHILGGYPETQIGSSLVTVE